jgi:hypothetical protein
VLSSSGDIHGGVDAEYFLLLSVSVVSHVYPREEAGQRHYERVFSEGKGLSRAKNARI